MTPHDILKSGFNDEIATVILDAYREIEHNYALRKWKPSELDAGHFVEGVRRALDHELTGSYIAFSKALQPFDDKALLSYENKTGDHSFRLLIPRALKSIYNIRNKRGVAHISDVNPNEMDATLILYNVKWILAELLRLKSGLAPEQTQKMIDIIVERKCPLIWKEGGIISVLSTRMSTKKQILVLLYDKSPIRDTELQNITEYINCTNFKKMLKEMHKQKLIYYHQNGNCHLSPVGISEAETIIQEHK